MNLIKCKNKIKTIDTARKRAEWTSSEEMFNRMVNVTDGVISDDGGTFLVVD